MTDGLNNDWLLIDLIYRLIDRLIEWWLINWWLIDWPIIDWWLTDRMNDDWLIDDLIDWLMID